MDKISKYWPVILAIFAIGSVSGAQQIKLMNLEDAVVQQADIRTKLIQQQAQVSSLTIGVNKLLDSYARDALEQKEFRRELFRLLQERN
jgi:hypothetical protein